jgi:parvulin-like peptidyl-prolyl isomerase
MLRKAVLVLIAVGALTLVLLPSCAQKKDDVVARVGDKEITLGDFNIAHKAITVFNRPPLVTVDDCEAFLKTLINKELLVGEALARGLDKNEKLLMESERWKMEMVIGALYKEVSESNVEVTVEELQDYYRLSRTTVNARHIQTETVEKAEEIARKIAAGEDFAKLAAEHSLDTRTAFAGGNLGTLRPGQVDPLIERVLFSLSPGGVSEPVKSMQGYHVLQVLDRTEPDMADFENQKAVCATELRSRKRSEAWNNYLLNVRESLGLEFNEENVLWLDGLLPERGSTDASWAEAITEEDRARPLAKSSEESWTVGDFVDYVRAVAGGPQPFHSENGSLIRSVAEASFVNKKNLAEGTKRGLEKSDSVVRGIQRKMEERLIDLVYAELTRDAVVPEETLREEYENQKDKLVMPTRVKLQIINLKDEETAKEVRRRVSAGESFDDLARQYNRGRMKEKAGVTELMTKESIPGELQRYAFEVLKIGEIAPVVRAPLSGAYFVAKLLERNPEHPMMFEEAKEGITPPLLQIEKDKMLGEWLEKRAEERGVTIDREKLNLLLEVGDAEAGIPGAGQEG